MSNEIRKIRERILRFVDLKVIVFVKAEFQTYTLFISRVGRLASSRFVRAGSKTWRVK